VDGRKEMRWRWGKGKPSEEKKGRLTMRERTRLNQPALQLKRHEYMKQRAGKRFWSAKAAEKEGGGL